MHKSHDICSNEAMKKEYKKYANKLTKTKLVAIEFNKFSPKSKKI